MNHGMYIYIYTVVYLGGRKEVSTHTLCPIFVQSFFTPQSIKDILILWHKTCVENFCIRTVIKLKWKD